MISRIGMFRISGMRFKKTSFGKKKKPASVVDEKPPNLVGNWGRKLTNWLMRKPLNPVGTEEENRSAGREGRLLISSLSYFEYWWLTDHVFVWQLWQPEPPKIESLEVQYWPEKRWLLACQGCLCERHWAASKDVVLPIQALKCSLPWGNPSRISGNRVLVGDLLVTPLHRLRCLKFFPPRTPHCCQPQSPSHSCPLASSW